MGTPSPSMPGGGAGRVVKILLQFILDQGGLKQVQQQLSGVAAGLKTAFKGPSDEMIKVGASVRVMAQQSNQSVQQVAKSWQGMETVFGMTEEQILKSVKAFDDLGSTSKRAVQATTQATTDLGVQIDQVMEKAPGIGHIWQIGIAGFTLAMTGTALQKAFKPIFKMIEDYSDFVGETEDSSARWIEANREIEQSFLRIGRVLAEAIGPQLEKAAGLAETVAQSIEAHPGLATGVVGVAVTGTALGKIMAVTGQMLSAFATFLNLSFLMKMTGATGGIGGLIGGLGLGAVFVPLLTALGIATAAIVALTAAVAVGVAAGVLIVEAIRAFAPDIIARQFAPAGKTLAGGIGAAGTLAARPIKWLLGAPEEEFEYRTSATTAALYLLIGGLDEVEKATLIASVAEKKLAADRVQEEKLEILPEEAVMAFDQYLQDKTKIEDEYTQERLDAAEEYEQEKTTLEKEWGEKRADIVADILSRIAELEANRDEAIAEAIENYQISEQRRYEDYLRRRQQITKKAREDEIRDREDHERRLRKLARDHAARMRDLVAARDALGVVREVRRYNEAVLTENERFAAQKQKDQQALQDRLQQIDDAYQVESQRRAEDQQRRLDEINKNAAEAITALRKKIEEESQELDEYYEERLEKLRIKLEEDLILLETAYDQALTALERSLIDRIRTIDATLLGDYNAYKHHLEMVSFSFRAWLADPTNWQYDYSGGGRASGGYVSSGVWTLGEKGYEYVLSHETTRALEQSLGALTQEKLTGLTIPGLQSGGYASRSPLIAAVGFSSGRQLTSRTVKLHQNFTFHGGFSEAEKRWFRDVAREEAYEGVLSVIGS